MNTITLEQIEAKIKDESYLVLPDGRSTLCILTMENGFTVKGLSACVDAANFDINAGRKVAREDAVRQIWMLEGYLLTERMYLGRETPVVTNPPRKTRKPRKKMKTAADIIELMNKMNPDGSWKKTEEAPWGYKKDGTPRKRPGRAAKAKE